ncbi:hypothetical protein B0J17DRAFT_706027 [Rhizoctonia solani]|nr:hypothetical protein B0J17DRAFT_706027 [Rhizoctonia solani]
MDGLKILEREGGGSLEAIVPLLERYLKRFSGDNILQKWLSNFLMSAPYREATSNSDNKKFAGETLLCPNYQVPPHAPPTYFGYPVQPDDTLPVALDDEPGGDWLPPDLVTNSANNGPENGVGRVKHQSSLELMRKRIEYSLADGATEAEPRLRTGAQAFFVARVYLFGVPRSRATRLWGVRARQEDNWLRKHPSEAAGKGGCPDLIRLELWVEVMAVVRLGIVRFEFPSAK